MISSHVVLGEDDSFVLMFLASQFQMPGATHLGMFLGGIKFLGSDGQFLKYEQGCRDFSIIGSYVQTELGHGSDVQRLETTATFDAPTQSFRLNTPTISSTKWWPGDLGVLANHALVFARLFAGGEDHGVQPFVVRIRDERGRVLPGI